MAVYVFGSSKSGELGTGVDKATCRIPTRVRGLPSIKQVASGTSFSLCLANDGALFAFGSAKHGRSGGASDSNVPQLVVLRARIVQISCGYWHSLALDEERVIWATGHNRHGQLGLGDTTDRPAFTRTSTADIDSVSAGGHASLAITVSKRLLGCGSPSISGLGEPSSVFRELPIADSVLDVSVGTTHAACCTVEGVLYTWGDNKFGQLGHGNKKNYAIPRVVGGFTGAVKSSCSKGEKYSHTSVLDVEGRIFSFGSGYKGQLGLDDDWDHSDPADRLRPEVIQDFRAESVICGGIHTLAVNQGTLYSWGCGSDGRIGHPESEGHRYLYREARPRALAGLERVASVSASYYHNIVSTFDS
mmetsp:Transcript_28803/g.51267  ORF Transcript_28803/g.51267 Transcript_28803/m.51267 type:complete len:360 (-) Transcript_28803:1491-2570(-)